MPRPGSAATTAERVAWRRRDSALRWSGLIYSLTGACRPGHHRQHAHRAVSRCQTGVGRSSSRAHRCPESEDVRPGSRRRPSHEQEKDGQRQRTHGVAEGSHGVGAPRRANDGGD